MSDAGASVLTAIVFALRGAGLAVSMRDYFLALEALEAIDDPFGYLAPTAGSVTLEASSAPDRHRLASRERLVWLIQTLWARSSLEAETIRRVIENEIAPAPPRYSLELARCLDRHSPSAGKTAPVGPRPPPADPLEDLLAKKPGAADASQAGEQAGDDGDEMEDALAAQIPVRVAVPDVRDTTLPAKSPYQFEETPVLDELSLTAIWRRFRQPHYVSDPRRIDIDRSVAATVGAGGMLRIVTARRRVNRARLAVLFDAGAAMAPWEGTLQLLRDTLGPEKSRLESVFFGYFSGAPGKRLFRDASLTDPIDLDATLRELSGSPLLVFGEAGAARAPRADLTRRLRDFLAATLRHDIRPVVWINPMPQSRWRRDVSDLIAGAAHASAFELRHEALIAAVAVLREQAS